MDKQILVRNQILGNRETDPMFGYSQLHKVKRKQTKLEKLLIACGCGCGCLFKLMDGLDVKDSYLKSPSHKDDNNTTVFGCSKKFVPPYNAFDLAILRIKVELLSESPTPTQRIMASSLEREFGKTFHRQVFTEYQRVVFSYKGISFACSVVEASPRDNKERKSLTLKQGIICQHTKVIVEVPQSLRTIIHGAKTFKSVLREGFNVELLEEELISLGIGGMRSQFVQILHQAFGSRMVSPAEAKRLNLRHVRGMLLYGPTGSGKTLIARNICKFLNAKEPLLMNGSDFVNELQGASLRRMRSLFKAAIKDGNRYGLESDLHVLIIDGIDSIAKKRGAMRYYRLDDRLVNQLVTMIDGMKALNNIFIIATSDREDLIEEALLREGRIELHVKVDYPDEQGRLQILDIQTTGVRQASMLDKDVNLQEIARRTDGYSGAALASLVTHAHSYTLVQLGKGELLNTVEEDVKITMNHFLLALEDFKSRRQESGLEPNRRGKEKEQPSSSSNSSEILSIRREIANLKVNNGHFMAEKAEHERELIMLQSNSSSIQEEIASLKKDNEHFQATLASYQKEKAKLEIELETLRGRVNRMEQEGFSTGRRRSI